MTEFNEDKKIYCRRLGHEVPFSYCAREGIDMPCRVVFQCWEGRMSIDLQLEKMYTPQQMKKLHAPAQPKLASLVDLIEQAKQQRNQ